MKIIDSRFRPYWKGFASSWLYTEVGEQMASNFNTRTSSTLHSMDDVLAQMDEGGITYGLVPGRVSTGITGADLADLQAAYPKRFITMLGVDPLMGEQYVFEQIEQYVVNGPCTGVNVEAVFGSQPAWVEIDSPILDGIYQKCSDLKIPVTITWGGRGGKNMDYVHPRHVENILLKFPELRVALLHGGWPFIRELIWLAFMHSNLWIGPDMYGLDVPFGDAYIKAANTVLKDRILFGSAFPVLNSGDVAAYYKRFLNENVQEKIFFENALTFLNITEDDIL